MAILLLKSPGDRKSLQFYADSARLYYVGKLTGFDLDQFRDATT
jgi:hypothetical protein